MSAPATVNLVGEFKQEKLSKVWMKELTMYRSISEELTRQMDQHSRRLGIVPHDWQHSWWTEDWDSDLQHTQISLA